MSSKDSRGVLIVEPPSQVRFNGPFTRPVVTTVTLINPTDYKIIFKIKTTAPSFYGVRPNFGVVQPRNFTEVEIARQPFNYDQNEKINHKFMVQSLAVPTNVEDLNKVWENADPSQLYASKLRCVFEMPKSLDNQISSMPLQVQNKSQQNESSGHTNQSANVPLAQKISSNDSTAIGMPKTILKNSSNQLLPTQALIPTTTMATTTATTTTTATKTVTTNPNNQLQPVYRTPPPPAKGFESNDNFTKNQLESLNTEVRQLYNENTLLRKENNVLKNEIDQIHAITTRREVATISRNQNNQLVDPNNDPYSPVNYLYVLSSVSIAVLSLFIGKYVL